MRRFGAIIIIILSGFLVSCSNGLEHKIERGMELIFIGNPNKYADVEDYLDIFSYTTEERKEAEIEANGAFYEIAARNEVKTRLENETAISSLRKESEKAKETGMHREVKKLMNEYEDKIKIEVLRTERIKESAFSIVEVEYGYVDEQRIYELIEEERELIQRKLEFLDGMALKREEKDIKKRALKRYTKEFKDKRSEKIKYEVSLIKVAEEWKIVNFNEYY